MAARPSRRVLERSSPVDSPPEACGREHCDPDRAGPPTNPVSVARADHHLALDREVAGRVDVEPLSPRPHDSFAGAWLGLGGTKTIRTRMRQA